MTSLIKQIFERARVKDHWSVDEARYLTDFIDLDKFAELVVKECTEVFWTNECNISDLAYVDYLEKCKLIKQHFGV